MKKVLKMFLLAVLGLFVALLGVVVYVGATQPEAMAEAQASRGSIPKATAYTKSGNCRGASEATLRFAPEPTAAMFPEAIWFENCPNGKYYMKIGDGDWKEITKKNADDGASMLKTAGRSVVRVVD